ncbi:DeoR/GlpR family DNA-binding transcription regulator [Clostridiaceae bacterium M8S5]|nr:DeoR/GlpR family DNA-binding transcription regulator [Clostridiaceae bacterium M8S5]
MLAVDRLKKIEELLIENGSVIISNLSELLKVSEETIRRDLEKLEKEKKLKRVRGGAYLPQTSDTEVPIKIRETIYIEEKQSIGSACIDLIEDGDCIMLDSSTTALYIAKNLNGTNKRLKVITNSLKITNEFENNKSVKVICLGGTLRKSTSSFVGYMTTDALENVSAHKAFVSCSSINAEFGVTDNHELGARVRKNMFKRSMKKYLIVDYTKFDSPAANKICDLGDIDVIITDRDIPKKYTKVLNEKDVDVIVVGKE